jgi:phosphoserine phosphatase
VRAPGNIFGKVEFQGSLALRWSLQAPLMKYPSLKPLMLALSVLLAPRPLPSPSARSLQGRWSLFNRQQLESLLGSLGKDSPGYDPARPPYAVFDWDNTSVFLDVEEATLTYQLDHLVFAATPAELEPALRQGLPDDPEVTALLDDVMECYSWLYRRTGSSKTSFSVAAFKGTPQLRSFRAKFLALYQLLEDRYGAALAYAWLPYRFTGMSAAEVRQLTRQAVRAQLRRPIETVQWRSAKSLPGRAGQVTVHWRSGLRLLPEMQELYACLREAGFEVWVCTASFVEGIREISSAPEFGYGNRPEQVIGLELATDSRGRYLPCNVGEITYAAGKTEAIRRRLVARYGYEPALIGGDSDGDAPMLADFPGTRLSLIMDAKRSPDSHIGQLTARARAQRGQVGSRYLFQERDEQTGQLLP